MIFCLAVKCASGWVVYPYPTDAERERMKNHWSNQADAICAYESDDLDEAAKMREGFLK